MQEVLVKRNLVEVRCCVCGVPFYVDALLDAHWREVKCKFYCPNGHEQAYRESEADKLRRELENCQTRRAAITQNCEVACQERNASEEKLERAQATLKRLRKQLKGGPHAK